MLHPANVNKPYKCLLGAHAVTTPQLWMRKPTFSFSFFSMPFSFFSFFHFFEPASVSPCNGHQKIKMLAVLPCGDTATDVDETLAYSSMQQTSSLLCLPVVTKPRRWMIRPACFCSPSSSLHFSFFSLLASFSQGFCASVL